MFNSLVCNCIVINYSILINLIFRLKKLRGHEQRNQDSSKYNKHKLIASAFAKRHQLNSNDFTVTFSKEDPFGKLFINGLNNFDLILKNNILKYFFYIIKIQINSSYCCLELVTQV